MFPPRANIILRPCIGLTHEKWTIFYPNSLKSIFLNFILFFIRGFHFILFNSCYSDFSRLQSSRVSCSTLLTCVRGPADSLSTFCTAKSGARRESGSRSRGHTILSSTISSPAPRKRLSPTMVSVRREGRGGDKSQREGRGRGIRVFALNFLLLCGDMGCKRLWSMRILFRSMMPVVFLIIPGYCKSSELFMG